MTGFIYDICQPLSSGWDAGSAAGTRSTRTRAVAAAATTGTRQKGRTERKEEEEEEAKRMTVKVGKICVKVKLYSSDEGSVSLKLV
jgi:hypothetical protein